MNIWIVAGSLIITTLILYFAYTLFKKLGNRLRNTNNLTAQHLSIAFAVFVISFLTLLRCKILSIYNVEPIKTIVGSGIHIPLLMLLFNKVFTIIYKRVFKLDIEPKFFSIVTICYIISCIFLMLLCILYLQDWSMFFLFVTMLLGKFIWFDGVNIGLNKEDFKDFLSQKFLLFLIAFCLIFIAILCFAETYGYINVVSIFIGMDFGMALAGIIIVTKEIKGVKKHIDLNIETPIDN